MKTKTIFKTLAMAMMMPAMMLTTACSSDDDAIANNPENNNQKGYAIPVTVNVTRQGDATTRATYNETDKVLEFSSGDQLFVTGTDGTAGAFAGTLAWQSGDTFSGTIYTENAYSGTAVAILTSASTATATLLPDGYGPIGYLSVSGEGYAATLATDATKAFATSKAAAVEQLSLEQATAYSNGFALAPQNAILNFTAVTGQWGSAPASSSVSLQAGETTISGSVAPVEGDYSRALANFAIAVAGSATPSSLTLTVDGTSVSLGSHTLTAGKIYNQKCANINAISPYIQENEKWLVYGTGTATDNQITIGDGATVTLDGVNISSSGYCIKCAGDATIILKDGSTNTLTSTGDALLPALSIGDANTTLTIQGSTGVLNVESGDYCAGIGGGYSNTNSTCGNIRIEGGVITVQGGYGGAGIGTDVGEATCGDIIITGGTITANGGGRAAGIGGGTSDYGNTVCGNITIANTVTKVTATAGNQAPYSIGKGYGGSASCGTVTIGGVVGAITESPFTYPAPAAKAAAEATAEDKGKLIGTDGNIYADVAAATAAGTTAVAKIIYLGTTGHSTYSHGLALALNDEASTMQWQAAINACSAKNTSTPVTNATWLLASKDQWNYMLGTNGAGSYTDLRDGFSGITGASNLQSDESARYWSSTAFDSGQAWRIYFYNGGWNFDYKDESRYVRACLAF